MRPGRYPIDHPLEIQARARLHAKTPQAQWAQAQRQQQVFEQVVRPQRAATQQARRWR